MIANLESSTQFHSLRVRYDSDTEVRSFKQFLQHQCHRLVLTPCQTQLHFSYTWPKTDPNPHPILTITDTGEGILQIGDVKS